MIIPDGDIVTTTTETKDALFLYLQRCEREPLLIVSPTRELEVNGCLSLLYRGSQTNGHESLLHAV